MKLEEKKQEIETVLTGKKISKVTYYQLANTQFHYNQERFHLCEVGIELFLNDESTFYFGWDFEYELIDSKIIPFKQLKRLSDKDDTAYMEDTVTNDMEWHAFTNKTITAVDIKWNWFEDLQENRHDIPVEICLHFENNNSIIMGAYQMDINHDEGLVKADNDSEGVVMIFFN